MAKMFLRKAEAVWVGELKSGNGTLSTESKALSEEPYAFETRFENRPGTNPEELIAAAHAGCYSMALSMMLKEKGFQPQRVETSATCTMVSKDNGGFEINKMDLHVRGEVEGLDEETFKSLAAEADQGCPVSNLLRCGLEISIHAELAAAR